MVPTKVFYTKGVGVHKDQLASFEMALRRASIEKYNLVNVSSILPANVKRISVSRGIQELTPGQIVHVVLAKSQTCEPNRLVSAAIGIATPAIEEYGYLSEHHSFGQTAKVAGEYAEDLAATMLATTLGIDLDPEIAWDERKQLYRASGKIFKTTNICQSAEGNKNGLWTTVLAAVVLLP